MNFSVTRKHCLLIINDYKEIMGQGHIYTTKKRAEGGVKKSSHGGLLQEVNMPMQIIIISCRPFRKPINNSDSNNTFMSIGSLLHAQN